MTSNKRSSRGASSAQPAAGDEQGEAKTGNLEADVASVITEASGVAADVAGVITEASGVATDVAGVITEASGVAADVAGVITEASGVAADVAGSQGRGRSRARCPE